MRGLIARFVIVLFAFLIAFPVNGYAKKKESKKIIRKIKKKNKAKLSKNHKKGLIRKHKKVKGRIENIDLVKKKITIVDKKKNIYHFDISESQLVNKKGDKVDEKKLIKGSRLRINYDVKSKGQLEAVNVKVKNKKENK